MSTYLTLICKFHQYKQKSYFIDFKKILIKLTVCGCKQNKILKTLEKKKIKKIIKYPMPFQRIIHLKSVKIKKLFFQITVLNLLHMLCKALHIHVFITYIIIQSTIPSLYIVIS